MKGTESMSTTATKPATTPVTIPERPVDIQRAILEQEREAWYNTVFQARARLEAQELIQRTFKREGGDALIKQLTDTIEDAVVAIGLFNTKLDALPEPTKAA
jgi:hypothetical protein